LEKSKTQKTEQQKAPSKDVVAYNQNAAVGNARTLSNLLERDDIMKSLSKIASKYMDVDRVAKMILLAASRQPKLYQCTQGSLLQASMKSVELGVSASGTLARGFIVPYWNNNIKMLEAQFIIGYGGLIDIICEPGGAVSHVTVEVVYKQDHFELSLGMENKLVHRPDPDAPRGNDVKTMRGAYMIAWIVRNPDKPFIHWMPISEILDIRDRFAPRNKNDDIVGPWKDNLKAMVKKTPVRSGAQYLPLSKAQQHKIEYFDEGISDAYASAPRVVPMTLNETPEGRQSWGPSDESAEQSPDQPSTQKSETDDKAQSKMFDEEQNDYDQMWTSFVSDYRLNAQAQHVIREELMTERFGVNDPKQISDSPAAFSAWLEGALVVELKKRKIIK